MALHSSTFISCCRVFLNHSYLQVSIIFKSGFLIHWVPIPLSWLLDLGSLVRAPPPGLAPGQTLIQTALHALEQIFPDSQIPLKTQAHFPYPFFLSRGESVSVCLQLPCSRLSCSLGLSYSFPSLSRRNFISGITEERARKEDN